MFFKTTECAKRIARGVSSSYWSDKQFQPDGLRQFKAFFETDPHNSSLQTPAWFLECQICTTVILLCSSHPVNLRYDCGEHSERRIQHTGSNMANPSKRLSVLQWQNISDLWDETPLFDFCCNSGCMGWKQHQAIHVLWPSRHKEYKAAWSITLSLQLIKRLIALELLQ